MGLLIRTSGKVNYGKFLFLMVLGFLLTGCQSDKFYVAYYDEKTDLYGLKNQSGKIILPSQYESFEQCLTYHEGDDINEATKLFHPSRPETEYLVPIIKKDQLFRITRDGTIKFASVYKDYGGGYDTDPNFIRFLEEGKVGFHDRKGDIVIPPRYWYAGPFKNGYALICEDCWAQDVKPKTYAPVSEYIWPFEATCACHRIEPIIKGGKWGAIDTSGKEIIPLNKKSAKEVEDILKKKFGWKNVPNIHRR